jgi:hypothetical protein
VVETVVPRGGLGKTLEAIHEFHKRHRSQAHTGSGRRDKNGRDYIKWCFANPGIAAVRKPILTHEISVGANLTERSELLGPLKMVKQRRPQQPISLVGGARHLSRCALRVVTLCRIE